MTGYIILTLGGLLFAAMVYRYDMHEREPWWMLVAAVLAGGLLMWGAFALEGVIDNLFVLGGPKLDGRLIGALSAGTLEEIAKLAVPVGVLLLIRKHFNDPMDGLLYGSMAGLGAALFESLWWQLAVTPPPGTTLVESQGPNAIRLLMHTIWGGIIGFPLGRVVMKKPWRLALLRCVGIVMLLHFLWDYFVGMVDAQTNWTRLIAAGILGGSVCWYGLLVVKANAWSRSMHAPTSKKRLMGKIVRAIFFRKFR